MNSHSIRIRKARGKDSKILAKLGAKTFFETYSDKVKKENLKLYIKQAFNKEKISEELKDKKSIFLIAFKNRKAIGYAKLNKDKKPAKLKNFKSIEIERMYVLKKMIGQKIGKSFMKKCLQIAKNGNYQVIWIGIWEHNKPAISLAKRVGFKIFGSQVFTLANENHKDLLMRKRIQ